jgi:hypothetical protein
MTTGTEVTLDDLEWKDEGCGDPCAEHLVSRLCEVCLIAFFVCPEHEGSVEACGDCS